MARYIEFATGTGSPILIEVDDDEVEPPPGVAKAGLLDRKSRKTIATAQESFDAAVKTAVHQNVNSLTAAVGGLAEPPSEVELTFGLTAPGEVGNIAVARLVGEANFTVRLAWKAAGRP
jgi:hypothetical protein